MGIKNLLNGIFGAKENTQIQQPSRVVTNTNSTPQVAVNDDMTARLNKIDLRKNVVSKICLEKKIDKVRARVVVAIDKSGSMHGLYRSGAVQRYLERIIPLALQFDDDGELDVFVFNDSFKEIGAMTKNNFYDFVEVNNICANGGTDYSPIMEAIYNKYQGMQPDNIATYVLFITDGNCWDEDEAERVIKEISRTNIFFQFVGIGNERKDFLERLDNMEGRYIDNANFLDIRDIELLSDEELYNSLLKEFPSYLQEAKSKGVLK